MKLLPPSEANLDFYVMVRSMPVRDWPWDGLTPLHFYVLVLMFVRRAGYPTTREGFVRFPAPARNIIPWRNMADKARMTVADMVRLADEMAAQGSLRITADAWYIFNPRIICMGKDIGRLWRAWDAGLKKEGQAS
jgi:hypothetical protein